MFVRGATTVAKHLIGGAMLAPFTLGMSFLATPFAISDDLGTQRQRRQTKAVTRRHRSLWKHTGLIVAGCHCDYCGGRKAATASGRVSSIVHL